MNAYQEMKVRHQAEFNAFPKFAAFNNEQFQEGMRKFGFSPTQTDEISSLGAGVFIRKSDKPALRELFDRQHMEMQSAIAADQTGDGFIYDMFDTELGNHEFSSFLCRAKNIHLEVVIYE